MTFTIDTDNNITAHDAPPAAQDNVVACATEKEFTKATAEWPINRLVEVWNGFAGAPPFGDLKPVKKFTDRKTAAGRIWKAIQVLGEELLRTSIRDAEAKLKAARTAATPAPQVPPKPAKNAKRSKAAKAAADAPTPASDASTTRVRRAFSKQRESWFTSLNHRPSFPDEDLGPARVHHRRQADLRGPGSSHHPAFCLPAGKL